MKLNTCLVQHCQCDYSYLTPSAFFIVVHFRVHGNHSSYASLDDKVSAASGDGLPVDVNCRTFCVSPRDDKRILFCMHGHLQFYFFIDQPFLIIQYLAR